MFPGLGKLKGFRNQYGIKSEISSEPTSFHTFINFIAASGLGGQDKIRWSLFHLALMLVNDKIVGMSVDLRLRNDHRGYHCYSSGRYIYIYIYIFDQ